MISAIIMLFIGVVLGIVPTALIAKRQNEITWHRAFKSGVDCAITDDFPYNVMREEYLNSKTE